MDNVDMKPSMPLQCDFKKFGTCGIWQMGLRQLSTLYLLSFLRSQVLHRHQAVFTQPRGLEPPPPHGGHPCSSRIFIPPPPVQQRPLYFLSTPDPLAPI